MWWQGPRWVVAAFRASAYEVMFGEARPQMRRKGVGGVGFVADCRNNLTCCRKEIKEKILIWILRTLYVQVKGVSSMAALGRKSTEIRNRILMMKTGRGGGGGQAMC